MIRVHEFTTLDGVVDVPMWVGDYGFPDDLGDAVAALTDPARGILLGRTTFQMFAQGWADRTVEDDPGAPFFNGTMKHVVTSTLSAADAEATWRNATVVGPYDPDRIRDLSRDGDLYVSGSATLVRALLADGLVDELHLFVYPVAVGEGIRLFEPGAPRTPLSLVGCAPLSNGVAHLTYAPVP